MQLYSWSLSVKTLMTDHDEEKLMCTHMSMYHEKVFTPAPNKKNHEGPTEIWTRITGFRVQSANHYTMGPCTVYVMEFVEAGVSTKVVFNCCWVLYGFNANISIRFQAVKNLPALPTHQRFGRLCKCFGYFWVWLGISIFSQRISKVDGNRKFVRFDVVLKLVKNW